VRLPIGVALFAGALAGGHLPDSLSGEILDSKCWFGAMQPSDSKVHKAGAPLCVRGDVPPAFFARGPAGQGAVMIMTAAGRAHGPELLGLVADPVRLTGRVFCHGDLLMLGACRGSTTLPGPWKASRPKRQVTRTVCAGRHLARQREPVRCRCTLPWPASQPLQTRRQRHWA